MTTATFNNRKIQMAQFVLTLTNPDVLDAIEATAKLAQSEGRRVPCTYSEEEVMMRLKESERDAIEGVGVSMDEVEALSNGWLV